MNPDQAASEFEFSQEDDDDDWENGSVGIEHEIVDRLPVVVRDQSGYSLCSQRRKNSVDLAFATAGYIQFLRYQHTRKATPEEIKIGAHGLIWANPSECSFSEICCFSLAMRAVRSTGLATQPRSC